MIFSTPVVKKAAIAAAVLVWLGITGLGLKLLGEYSFATESSEVASAKWPEEAQVALHPAGFTLVVALHPECPCSRASLEEIERIVVFGGERLRTVALFAGAGFSAEEVRRSGLWRRAEQLKFVATILDPEGEELRRFGFRTSGETRLYAADGTLRFAGGVTLARGHAGDNPGRNAIETVLSGAGPVEFNAMPTFGCGLFSHGSAQEPSS